ncbi:transketolase family protein [Harryflintia acetispora]|uniref:transketolase family protein n=1 Tax=Harryflintia acetispora TaxID=1849041 RepID=UPI001897D265|nr:transketolase C-terminal domain-containing protein [Harryflintia acetispora]
MQKAYLTALYELMEKDQNVYSLLSDSGTEYDKIIIRSFPNQCFNFGIAEEHKVAAASGMAAMGKIPFINTTGAFLSYRAYEFIRDDICFQNRNVKILGVGSGVSISTLGPSHHATEDISALRVLPNLTLFSPASPRELKKCIAAAYKRKGPVYIRVGMSGEKEILGDCDDYSIETIRTLINGTDIVLFVTGSIAAEVADTVALLKADHIDAKLVNVPTLKPADPEDILAAIKDSRYVFTIEEHSVIGGLGSIVAEIMADAGVAVPLKRIGLNDCFASGYGSEKQVLQMNGLDGNGIYRQVVAEL